MNINTKFNGNKNAKLNRERESEKCLEYMTIEVINFC